MKTLLTTILILALYLGANSQTKRSKVTINDTEYSITTKIERNGDINTQIYTTDLRTKRLMEYRHKIKLEFIEVLDLPYLKDYKENNIFKNAYRHPKQWNFIDIESKTIIEKGDRQIEGYELYFASKKYKIEVLKVSIYIKKLNKTLRFDLDREPDRFYEIIDALFNRGLINKKEYNKLLDRFNI